MNHPGEIAALAEDRRAGCRNHHERRRRPHRIHGHPRSDRRGKRRAGGSGRRRRDGDPECGRSIQPKASPRRTTRQGDFRRHRRAATVRAHEIRQSAERLRVHDPGRRASLPRATAGARTAHGAKRDAGRRGGARVWPFAGRLRGRPGLRAAHEGASANQEDPRRAIHRRQLQCESRLDESRAAHAGGTGRGRPAHRGSRAR